MPRPVVLRLFLVHDGTAWRAMPGGLARIMDESERLTGRAPDMGVSKDVWVLSEDRGDIVGPPAHAAPALKIRRTPGDLPSRVADNLFWLGRYVERLDRASRLGRSALQRLVRAATLLPHEEMELQALAACLVEAGLLPKEGRAVAGLGQALLETVRDGGKVEALFGSVAALTEGVRDRLTDEMYATFTTTLRAARADVGGAGRSLDRLLHGMVGVKRFATAVAGVAAENMVRGGGWVFLELGRRLERAWSVAGEVSIALDQPPPRIEAGLRLVLELCDSAITYRSRYLDVLQPAPVLDLVLADQGNPRGLGFQLAQMHALLDELQDEGGPREMLAGTAAGLLAEAEMIVEALLAAPDQAAAAAAMAPRLRAIEAAIAALSDRITRRYFALLPAVQTLGWSSADPSELLGGGMRYRVRHVTRYAYRRGGRSGQPPAAPDAAVAAGPLGAAGVAADQPRSLAGDLRRRPFRQSHDLGVPGPPPRTLRGDGGGRGGRRLPAAAAGRRDAGLGDGGRGRADRRPGCLARRRSSPSTARWRRPTCWPGGTRGASFPPGRPVLAGLLELNGRMRRDFTFRTGVTTRVHPGRQGDGASAPGSARTSPMS